MKAQVLVVGADYLGVISPLASHLNFSLIVFELPLPVAHFNRLRLVRLEPMRRQEVGPSVSEVVPPVVEIHALNA